MILPVLLSVLLVVFINFPSSVAESCQGVKVDPTAWCSSIVTYTVPSSLNQSRADASAFRESKMPPSQDKAECTYDAVEM